MVNFFLWHFISEWIIYEFKGSMVLSNLKSSSCFLKVAKNRNTAYKELRKGIGKQLRYVNRNLGHINKLSEIISLKILKKKEYKNLLVISELYRQQKDMYANKVHSVPNRIVSITQPHVRPIVRADKFPFF